MPTLRRDVPIPGDRSQLCRLKRAKADAGRPVRENLFVLMMGRRTHGPVRRLSNHAANAGQLR